MSKIIVEKVVACITHVDKLLVFSHPSHPEAGIQVPGGTMEEREPPADAVMREAKEETGLHALEMRSYLGVREVDQSPHGRAEIHRRHFFHLELCRPAPATWRHYETDPSDGSPGPIEFAFFWAALPDQIPELIGDQGALLDRLRRQYRGWM